MLINSLSYFVIYFILISLTCRKGWIQSDKRNIDLKSRNSKIGGVNQKNANYKYFHKELTNAIQDLRFKYSFKCFILECDFEAV